MAPRHCMEAEADARRAWREVERLHAAIRQHRDARGDDRCWMDDEELYRVLPEGFTPPVRDSSVELARCAQFITSRQNPATTYVSPEREIERLRAVVSDVKRQLLALALKLQKLQ